MNDAMIRTVNIRGDLRRRTTVLRTLQLMVMNGVVRRAETDLPRHPADSAESETDGAALGSPMPPDTHEPTWFTRFFRRRGESPFKRARHRI